VSAKATEKTKNKSSCGRVKNLGTIAKEEKAKREGRKERKRYGPVNVFRSQAARLYRLSRRNGSAHERRLSVTALKPQGRKGREGLWRTEGIRLTNSWGSNV